MLHCVAKQLTVPHAIATAITDCTSSGQDCDCLAGCSVDGDPSDVQLLAGMPMVLENISSAYANEVYMLDGLKVLHGLSTPIWVMKAGFYQDEHR